MDLDLQPVLENDLVLLRPLRSDDFEGLYKAASDPLIWEQHQNNDRYMLPKFTDFFNESIASRGALAIIDAHTQEIIGSSRFKQIDKAERVVEIGWSFLERKYWGGRYNREIKKIMINYALEHYKNVVFYVNSRNLRSQQALEKIGAEKLNDADRSWALPTEIGVTYVVNSKL